MYNHANKSHEQPQVGRPNLRGFLQIGLQLTPLRLGTGEIHPGYSQSTSTTYTLVSPDGSTDQVTMISSLSMGNVFKDRFPPIFEELQLVSSLVNFDVHAQETRVLF